MQTPKSRVYVQTDETGRVLRLEGEYSLPADLAGWVKIDEGFGDKFSLAQSHYLVKPDKAALPTPEPTAEDDTNAMIVDHEYRLTLLELGLNE